MEINQKAINRKEIKTVAEKSPSENLREKLKRRTTTTLKRINPAFGKLSESQKKTPSQKKSESARKKDARRAGIKYVEDPNMPSDCHTCQEIRVCQIKDTNKCQQKTMVHRCKQCGVKVRHYVDSVLPWEYCPVCIVNRSRRN